MGILIGGAFLDLDRVFPGLPSIAHFEVGEQFCDLPSPGVKRVPFRDPAGMTILSRVSTALGRAGYEIRSGPRPGKGCDAALTCRLRGWRFYIVIVLIIGERGGGPLRCALRMFPSRRLLGGVLGRVRWVGPDFPEQWDGLCRIAEKSLLEDVRAVSFLWMTRKEDTALVARNETWL